MAVVSRPSAQPDPLWLRLRIEPRGGNPQAQGLSTAETLRRREFKKRFSPRSLPPLRSIRPRGGRSTPTHQVLLLTVFGFYSASLRLCGKILPTDHGRSAIRGSKIALDAQFPRVRSWTGSFRPQVPGDVQMVANRHLAAGRRHRRCEVHSDG